MRKSWVLFSWKCRSSKGHPVRRREEASLAVALFLKERPELER